MGGPLDPDDELQVGELVAVAPHIKGAFSARHGYVALYTYYQPAQAMRYALRGFGHGETSFSDEELLRARPFCRIDLRRCIWTFHGIVLLE